MGTTTWSTRRAGLLKQLAENNWSGGQIARELSRTGPPISRCAVISKAHRMKVRLRGVYYGPRYPVHRHGRKQRQWATPELVELVAQEVELPAGEPAILALTDSNCRWPIGDPQRADFRYCCAPAA